MSTAAAITETAITDSGTGTTITEGIKFAPAEVERLLGGWGTVPPVPRRPCACGRAYVLGLSPGAPCGECKVEIAEEAQWPRCDRCGDEGWVWHPDAVRFASEMDARTPCPDCSPDSGPAYD